MRKLCAAMAITVASLALFEGCAPVPLPHYAAYKPRRVQELLVDSENMRQAGDDWERFWLLDQPSHLTPYRVHGGMLRGLTDRPASTAPARGRSGSGRPLGPRPGPDRP